MKAFQLVEWQKPCEIREVSVPEPGPGQILIKIGGAGACHSDLHLMEAPQGAKPIKLPGLGREAGIRRDRVCGRGPSHRLWSLGLRPLRKLPVRHGELLREPRE